MTHLRDLPPFPLLQFYATAPYVCSYLPGRMARSQVATPTHLIDPQTYAELVRSGFRRSGVFTYRPHCDTCRECQPVRVDINGFAANRSQRRSIRRHKLLTIRERPLQFDEDHYQLYQRYQFERHNGGGMDQDNREQYSHFLLQTHVDTRLIEFSEGDSVRMVSLVDVLDDGLSSVYTFYDPANVADSLGTYSVLWQIAQCQHLGLPYLYLGYWIRQSRKMAYKSNFSPLEVYQQGGWTALPD